MTDVVPDAGIVTRVSTLAAASSRPALTADEVVAAIQAHPLRDADGLLADQPGWTPTWDLYVIVSELWATKAAKVAGDFTFGADGSNYSKGDVIAQCLEMEAHYASKIMGSTNGGTGAYDPLKGVVVNG